MATAGTPRIPHAPAATRRKAWAALGLALLAGCGITPVGASLDSTAGAAADSSDAGLSTPDAEVVDAVAEDAALADANVDAAAEVTALDVVDISDTDAGIPDVADIAALADVATMDAAVADVGDVGLLDAATVDIGADATADTGPKGPPTLTILTPQAGTVYWLDASAGTVGLSEPVAPCKGGSCVGTGETCSVSSDCPPYAQFGFSNFALTPESWSAVNCRLDGGAWVVSTNPASVPSFFVPGHPDMLSFFAPAQVGLHALECWLVDANGAELKNLEAHAFRTFAVVHNPYAPGFKCTTAADCDDANECSIDDCKQGNCSYSGLANCCWDDWMCAPGQACAAPKTLQSACVP